MKKLFILSRSNIRQGKGQTISFFFIILIGAILLNIGLITALNFSKHYDKQSSTYNSANGFLALKTSEYNPEYYNYIKNSNDVDENEERNIKLANGEITFQSSLLSQNVLIYDYNDKTSISNRILKESITPVPRDAVYLPYVLKTAGGLGLGDTFTLKLRNKKYTYTVAGFYEDFTTSRFSFGSMGITLNHNSYEELLSDNVNIFDGKMLLYRIKDSRNNNYFFNSLKSYIAKIKNNDTSSMFGYADTDIKQNAMVTAFMMMMIMIAFSLIITIVSLIVIKFRISNSIEDNIQNIGALKALGYTSRQIILSYMIQFGSIALLGTILGIISSLALLPTFTTMISTNAGITWKQGLDFIAILITITIIVGTTLLVSLLSAKKIKKLPPITALRDGIAPHNFRKNVLPLTKTPLRLNIALAIKTAFQSLRQNIMIVLIVTTITFTSTFALVMYQNMAVDKEKFTDLISGEFSSIALELGDSNYNDTLKNELLLQKGVRKVSFYDLFGEGYLKDSRSVMIFLSENFDDTENKKCYLGRDPKFDNEIVLNGHLAQLIGKKIGETVEISNGNLSYNYLITGLMQSGNGNGFEAELTIDGYHRINPSYQMKNLNVYTTKDAEVNEVIYKLQDYFGDTFIHYTNMDESKESMTKTYSQVVFLLAIAIVFITALIIALIIYLSIKTVITRQKQELGIKKALGFTTRQLMIQLALSFTPMVSLGCILGGLLGFVAVNPLLSVMMRGMGIIKVNFTIPVLAIIALCIFLSIFAFFIAMLIARKIKKIYPYQLVSE